MTRDEITRLASEAGFETMITKGKIHGLNRDGDYTEELQAFAALVADYQRERCAQVCENQDHYVYDEATIMASAIAIRSRS